MFEAFIGALLAFTFLELIWIVSFVGIGFLSSNVDNTIGGLISIVLFFFGIWYFYDVNLVENAFTVFLGLVAYFLGGGLYTLFFSWPEWLEYRSKSIKSNYDEWKKGRKDDGTDLSKDFYDSYRYAEFTAARNYDTIAAMITTWIFDALWRVVSDPLSWAWRKTYEIFAGAYEKVSRRVVGRIIEEE